MITGQLATEQHLAPLRRAGYEVHHQPGVLSEAELAEALRGCTGYVLGGDEYASAAALAGAKELKAIAFMGAGYETFVDVDAATGLGIMITNTPGVLTNSVAEFTVGLLLDAWRRITQYANSYRRGEHGVERKQRDLAGRHVGIVGLGAVGTRVAEILRWGFGCEVSYTSKTRKPAEEQRLGITALPLLELATTSDALVLHVPGNDSTHGLIDEQVLRAMGPESVLINAARSEVVDAAAVGTALREHWLRMAVFDGFYQDERGAALLAEFADDQLLVTGHIASLTHDACDAMAQAAMRSIINVLSRGADPHIVNSVEGGSRR